MDSKINKKFTIVKNAFNNINNSNDPKLNRTKLIINGIQKSLDNNKQLNIKQLKFINTMHSHIINDVQTTTNDDTYDIPTMDENDIAEPKIKPYEYDKPIDKNEKEQQNDFYSDFISSKVKNKEWLNNQVIHLLHKQPKKDKDNPSYQAPIINSQHQADLLFLPYDKKNQKSYKFLLVVVDIHTRLIDAEPLKTKNSDEIAQAFEKIYKRPILDHPIEIITDSGSEFKGDCLKYFKKHKIFHKPQKTGKKIGIVDSKIKIIGDAVIKRELAEQLLTHGDWSDNWNDDIPHIVNLINDFTKKKYKPKTGLENPDILHKKDGLQLLKIGTKVRVASYYPKDYDGNRLSGDIRSADIKWDIKHSIITDYVIRPNSPIMYVVDNDYTTFYTKNRLQIIKPNEQLPNKSILKPKHHYVKSRNITTNNNTTNDNTTNDLSNDNHNDKKIIQTRSGRVSRPLSFYDDDF
jgi:hypothetical protein